MAHKLNDNKVLGTAYYAKGYVESVKKKYERALDYRLKAEEYLKETDDLYTLNQVKASIGTTYYLLEEYKKAYNFFKETVSYHFDNKKITYNNKKSYVIHLFGLSKSAYRLQKYDTLQVLIKDGYTEIQNLKAHHQPLETAYFSFVEGMYNHELKNYQRSDSLLQSALPEIKKNDDPTNEHLGYVFLGKNAWEQNQKEKAFGYFLKADSLYQNKNIINAELSEAYTYIIDYYKEQKNTEKQLYYTDILLQISNELQTQNRRLTSYIHSNIDTKKLKESKAELKNELTRNQKWVKYAYTGIAILIGIIIGLFVKYRIAKRKLQSKYELLISNSKIKENNTIVKAQTAELTDTAQIILQKLIPFENDKGFLQKITLEDLAKYLLTNRTTLSNILNEHKGGFKQYLRKLRVDYAVNQISSNSDLQNLSLDALAEQLGFGNAKSFSGAFKEVTDMHLVDFINLSKKAS